MSKEKRLKSKQNNCELWAISGSLKYVIGILEGKKKEVGQEKKAEEVIIKLSEFEENYNPIGPRSSNNPNQKKHEENYKKTQHNPTVSKQ